jgi:hypothetical protein
MYVVFVEELDAEQEPLQIARNRSRFSRRSLVGAAIATDSRARSRAGI